MDINTLIAVMEDIRDCALAMEENAKYILGKLDQVAMQRDLLP